MKNPHNTLTCLFGHHDYSKELVHDGRDVGCLLHLCGVCGRSGYVELANGYKRYHDYDEDGNLTRFRYDVDGSEYLFNKEGRVYFIRDGDGRTHRY